MTLKQHIDAVKELYYRGAGSDDTKYSDKFIAHLLHTVRATIIRQKLDKGKPLTESMYQTFCMDFVNSEFHNCNCASGTCEYKKSLYPVVSPFETTKGASLIVMNLEGEVIDNVTMTTNKYARKYSLIKDKLPLAWFYHDQHIYVLNSKYVQKLLIKTISNDIQELGEACTTNGSNCTLVYSQNFIDPDLTELLYQKTLALMMSSKVLNDKLNDNNDGTVQSDLGMVQRESTN